MTFDNQHMARALENALYAQASGEVPVGAVIVNRETDEIISNGFNKVEVKNNPMMHAEMVAIESACKALKTKNLSNCDIYVTLEPCTMCAAAISHAKIGRVFYGASDTKGGAIENGVRFFTQETCLHRPEVYNGILAEESSEMLKLFFENLRD